MTHRHNDLPHTDVESDMQRELQLQVHAENVLRTTGVQFSPMFDSRRVRGINFQHRLDRAAVALEGLQGEELALASSSLEGLREELVSQGLVFVRSEAPNRSRRKAGSPERYVHRPRHQPIFAGGR